MKIYVQQVRQDPIEIDISPDSSLDDLRELLIAQYSYPRDKKITFLFNGAFLADDTLLSKLEENSRIIAYIKNNNKNTKEEKKSENNNSKTESETAHSEEPKPKENTENSENAENKTKSQYAKRKNIVTDFPLVLDNEITFFNILNAIREREEDTEFESNDQIEKYIKDVFEKIHVQQLYDDDNKFYNQLNETQRISDMIDHNPGLILVFTRLFLQNYVVAHDSGTVNIDNAMEFAGFTSSTPTTFTEEYQAKFESLPKYLQETVRRLERSINKHRNEVVDAFFEAKFDEKVAEQILTGNSS